MKLFLFCLFLSSTCAEVQFSTVNVLGTVSAGRLDENSGLAVSRVHARIVYGQNDHGDSNRVFALDPMSGDLKATLTIDGAHNHDWEDLCVGPCGQGLSGSCLYIGDIGSGNKQLPRTIYKVREPSTIEDSTLPVLDTYTFTWAEDDAESLMIDPSGDLYIISKVHGGDALFAKLPRSGWSSAHPVHVGVHDSVRLGLRTSHNDPQGADLSPDGRYLLVKTEESVVVYEFSAAQDYVSELGQLRPRVVTTYVRRPSGESVAWTGASDGFYTLPEGQNPVFNYYSVVSDLIG